MILGTNLLAALMRVSPVEPVIRWLDAQADLMFGRDFRGRVLPFDARAADAFGTLSGMRRAVGKPISSNDGYIAAIATVNGMPIATRNVKDFEGMGLPLIDRSPPRHNGAIPTLPISHRKFVTPPWTAPHRRPNSPRGSLFQPVFGEPQAEIPCP